MSHTDSCPPPGHGKKFRLTIFFHYQPCINSITNYIFSPTGKTFTLLFKSVTIEDASEITFSAENVSLTSKLKVKGNVESNTVDVVNVLEL